MGGLATSASWGPALVLLPLAAAMLAFLWPRGARATGLLAAFALAATVAGLAAHLLEAGVYRHPVGGWAAPLGIALYADGLSLVMLGATALVGCGVSVYAAGYFGRGAATRFWPLWMLLWAALNALFLAGDVFNLYVGLELMGLAAVALTALTGGTKALRGAMRYLLASMVGALAYLLGVALLYHDTGTVDLATLSGRVAGSPSVHAALGLMGAGLLLKTAVFPLHFWLPPAHASASPPVSAALSALVIKASFYMLVRLWLDVFEPVGGAVDEVMGTLGAAAVLWGSVQALRQTRLKLLVAYSTVAQIGYLFVAFPLAAGGGTAWTGAAYLALSHGLAKGGMFLAVGNFVRFGGHDRIADLDRIVQRLPRSAAAFALAGVTIMGLPPSGGFVAKWMLLEAAVVQDRWDLAVVLVAGGLLAAGYVFKVLGRTVTQADVDEGAHAVPASMEWAALALATIAVLAGLFAAPITALLGIGAPFGVQGVAP